MFDLTSSKLLILAIIALIVVGPKDLPILLRTVGKYLGLIRRQAAEFRAQLDEALRESELDELKKEFEKAGKEVRDTVEEGTRSLNAPVHTALTDGTDKKPAERAPDTGVSGNDAPASDPSVAPEASSEKTGT
jgi:sec-independent protein translocase protein TatB